jgi:hypothetical protein
MPVSEYDKMSPREIINELWGADVLAAIDRQHTVPMTIDEFMVVTTQSVLPRRDSRSMTYPTKRSFHARSRSYMPCPTNIYMLSKR